MTDCPHHPQVCSSREVDEQICCPERGGLRVTREARPAQGLHARVQSQDAILQGDEGEPRHVTREPGSSRDSACRGPGLGGVRVSRGGAPRQPPARDARPSRRRPPLAASPLFGRSASSGKPAWVEGDHMQPGGVFISYPGVYEVNEEPNDLETVRGSAGWGDLEFVSDSSTEWPPRPRGQRI